MFSNPILSVYIKALFGLCVRQCSLFVRDGAGHVIATSCPYKTESTMLRTSDPIFLVYPLSLSWVLKLNI